MAFPFILQENFETGSKGGFTTEVDLSGRLDFPDHHDNLGITPWRGGYVMRADLNRGTEEAYVEHTSALNMPPLATRYIRFMLYVSSDFRLPPGQSMKIFRVYSAGPVTPENPREEVAVGISRADSQINTPRLSIWTEDDGSFIDGLSFPLGRWFSVQITIYYGGSLSANMFLHVGDNTLQANRLTFADFTLFRLGAMAQSPDARGTLYFDDFIIDTSKLEDPVYVDPDQFSGESLLFTKTSYLFVGEGVIRGATLISGGIDNVALFYDVDRLPVIHHDIKAALKCSMAESKDSLIEGVRFKRGCYLRMTGTNPQVIAHFGAIGPTPAEIQAETDNEAA